MKKLLFMMLFSLPLLGLSQGRGSERDQNNKEIFTIVDQMPEFPGGTEALYRFINKNVRYPLDMRKQKIEAKVFASFVVDGRGRINNIEVINKVPQAFIDETIRVLKRMPAWKPGRQNGKPVNVKFTLPIDFRLN
jgi:periplasmic protein TonB